MPRGIKLNPKHSAMTRAKIQTTQIINRLQSFIMGEVEMTGPQVSAALGILKKTLPDLSAVDMSMVEEKRDVREMSNAELEAAILRNTEIFEKAGEVLDKFEAGKRLSDEEEKLLRDTLQGKTID